ncbi:MAG: glycosyltransferase [Candidatus Omnitrophica bacterium]|nr:glycosyltransferase [Candidatus Omnitrophota bacterium]
MSNKIKLLAVIHSLHGGGAERQFIHIVNNLDRKSFDIAVCLFEKQGIYVHDLPNDVKIYDLKRAGIFSFIKLIWRLKKVIDADVPQMIYSRHWKPNILTIIARLLAKSKPRIVITEEAVLSDALTFEYGRSKWLISLLVKWCYPLADRVVSVSDGVNKDLINNFGLPAQKGAILHNMVDDDYIKNKLESSHRGKADIDAQNTEGEKEFVVTSMGRLNKQKGYTDLIEAIRIVNESMPCRLEILGEGPELHNLQRLIAQYHLTEKVLFRGFQENPFKFIRNSDVFAMASLFEGLSCVLLEAMAVGVPIIYTDVSGVRDVAEDGKEILIVPPRSPEILAEKIIFLSKNPEYCKKLAENAQIKAQNFSVEKSIKKLENLFLSLCR